MRALVFLLILANLIFFAWVRGFFVTTPESDASRMSAQLHADKVQIVSRSEPPATGGKSRKVAEQLVNVETKEAGRCFAWDSLPVADAQRAEKLVAEKFPEFKASHATKAGEISYWVFIPPLTSKDSTEKKAAELKKMKVPEYRVVQDAGPYRNAISLGVFSKKEAAEERLASLRALGVRSAKVGERPGKAAVLLEIHGPEGGGESLRQAVGELLPDAKPAECRAAAAQ